MLSCFLFIAPFLVDSAFTCFPSVHYLSEGNLITLQMTNTYQSSSCAAMDVDSTIKATSSVMMFVSVWSNAYFGTIVSVDDGKLMNSCHRELLEDCRNEPWYWCSQSSSDRGHDTCEGGNRCAEMPSFYLINHCITLDAFPWNKTSPKQCHS
jgi:hypothetical protein